MKYCSNCGTGLSDDAVFCPNCGRKQDQPVTAQPNVQPGPYTAPVQPNVQNGPYAQPGPYAGVQPVYGNAAPSPQKSKKPFIIIGAVIAAIVLAIILLPKIGIGGGGYESAFNNFCQAINNKSISKLHKCLPPTTETALKGMISLGGMDEDEIFDEFFGSMGDNVKVDYKILDAVHLDSYELSEYQGNFSGDAVTDGYNVEVEMKIRINGETETEVDDMTVIKIGNRWCFADFMF